jgi:hypothetical protein
MSLSFVLVVAILATLAAAKLKGDPTEGACIRCRPSYCVVCGRALAHTRCPSNSATDLQRIGHGVGGRVFRTVSYPAHAHSPPPTSIYISFALAAALTVGFVLAVCLVYYIRRCIRTSQKKRLAQNK